MHACSCYWGSEALGCRTHRLESQSSAGLRMQAYPRAPDLVWVGHLHGTGCLSARAIGTGLPIFVWRLSMGPGCAWVWVPVNPSAFAGVLVGCVWVWVEVAAFFSRLGFAVSAVGLGVRPASHHSWVRCWGVRGCVRAPPVLRRSGFRCAVWACVLAAPPPPPLWCFLFFRVVVCRVMALWCRSLAVPVLNLVVSVSPPPLVRAAPSCVFCFLFLSPQCGVRRRVRGVPSFGGPLPPVWCCRCLAGWSSGAMGGPVLGAVWPGGLVAFCSVGGRFRGCGPFTCPSPP